MDARVVAVGSELLGGRADTNGPETCRRLARLGFSVASLEVVPDDLGLASGAIAHALACAPLVVVLGGLGPTRDDLTREAVAQATGLALTEDAAGRTSLEAKVRAAGRPAPSPAVLRMALVPEGASVVPNPVGQALGSVTRVGRSVLVLLPGPPSECLPMLDDALERAVRSLDSSGLGRPGPRGERRVLRVAGLPESVVEARLDGLPELVGETAPRVSFLWRPGDVEVHLVSTDPSALARAVEAASRALGPHVYSADGRSLAEVVVPVLAERFETVTFAESCTGGLLCGELTSVPGSSSVLRRAFVVYADDAKTALLGVPPGLLQEHGAVSSPVAEAMARGARRAGEADWALAVTGIAGPGGGSPDKPLGLVFAALAMPDGAVRSERHQFPGDRDGVRRRSVQAALDLLRRSLLGLG